MNQLEEITKYVEARCQENERLTFGSTYRHGAWQEDLWILAELDRMRESSKSTEPDTEYIRKDALLEWAKDTLELAAHTSPVTDRDILGYMKGISAVLEKIKSL